MPSPRNLALMGTMAAAGAAAISFTARPDPFDAVGLPGARRW